MTAGFAFWNIGPQLEYASKELFALFGFLFLSRHVLAPFYSCSIKPASTGRIRALIPAPAAADAGTNHDGLANLGLVATDQGSLLVDSLDPIDILRHRPGGDKLACRAVEHERVATLVYIEQQLARLTLDW